MTIKSYSQSYDSRTKTYTFTLHTKIGNFSGKATCHSADKENEFIGYHIAETRATIQYMKYKLQKANIESKAVNDLYKQMKCYKCYDESATLAKLLKKQVIVKAAAARALKFQIDDMKSDLNEYIRKRVKSAETAITKNEK